MATERSISAQSRTNVSPVPTIARVGVCRSTELSVSILKKCRAESEKNRMSTSNVPRGAIPRGRLDSHAMNRNFRDGSSLATFASNVGSGMTHYLRSVDKAAREFPRDFATAHHDDAIGVGQEELRLAAREHDRRSRVA